MQISDYYASHSNTHYTGAGTDHPGISYEDQYQICTTMNGYESCYTKPHYTK